MNPELEEFRDVISQSNLQLRISPLTDSRKDFHVSPVTPHLLWIETDESLIEKRFKLQGYVSPISDRFVLDHITDSYSGSEAKVVGVSSASRYDLTEVLIQKRREVYQLTIHHHFKPEFAQLGFPIERQIIYLT